MLLQILERNLHGDSSVSQQSLRTGGHIYNRSEKNTNKKELTTIIHGHKILIFPGLRFLSPEAESLPRYQKRYYQRRNLSLILLKNKLWVLYLNQSLLFWDTYFVMQLLEISQVGKRDMWLQSQDRNSQRKTRANC